MSLLRGAGEDLPLKAWLENQIWPLEAALMSPEFVFEGAVLAACEMLLGGDHLLQRHVLLSRADRARRDRTAACVPAVGIVLIDFPTAYGTGPEDYLRKGLALHERAARRTADQLHAGAACPLHGGRRRLSAGIRPVGRARPAGGLPPARRLSRLPKACGCMAVARWRGWTGWDWSAPSWWRCTRSHLDDDDIDLMASRGVSVAHCPHSNLKLASGMAPTARLLSRGVDVEIGPSGSASNNRLDLFVGARPAVQLAKATSGDATGAGRSSQALEAVTLAGARALGWPTGSARSSRENPPTSSRSTSPRRNCFLSTTPHRRSFMPWAGSM
jgi:5-methylthioadenosine/S-adenosylhomocysteine deaminase